MVEFLDRILPGMDGEVAQAVPAHPGEAGHDVQARRPRSPAIDTSGKTLKASVEPAAGGAAETIEADVVLVAIGRVPYTEGLGLDEARRRARQARPRRRRRAFRHQRRRHLRDRRRDRRPDAGAQGRGRGRRGRGDPRRPGRPRELRRDPERGLHLPGSRLGRQDRGGAEGGRRRLQGRQVSVHRQRPRQGQPAPPTAS